MSVTIRLTRQGRSHRPFYRITVADARRSPTGKFLEQVGFYDPNLNPPSVKVDEEAVVRWLKNGAKPSDTVRDLLHKAGIMEKEQLISKGKATATSPLKVRPMVEKKKPKVHKVIKAAAEAAKTAAAAEATKAAAAKVAEAATAKAAAAS